jgi:hypothetical protein
VTAKGEVAATKLKLGSQRKGPRLSNTNLSAKGRGRDFSNTDLTTKGGTATPYTPADNKMELPAKQNTLDQKLINQRRGRTNHKKHLTEVAATRREEKCV